MNSNPVSEIIQVAIERLHPNPRQPRRRFTEKATGVLADSIRANGLLQPILARRHPARSGEFEIVSGERRWRAAKLAELHEVPVTVRPLSDRTTLEFALIENLHREDLTALELAEGYRQLMQEFQHTQKSLAQVLGKSRSHIANTLRLLNLPPAVKENLHEGKLSAGHARVLLKTERPEALARQVISERLSVRATERLAKSRRLPNKAAEAGPAQDDPTPTETWRCGLEPTLSTLLGQTVRVWYDGQRYVLTIHCPTPAELADIVKRLKQALRTGDADAAGSNDARSNGARSTPVELTDIVERVKQTLRTGDADAAGSNDARPNGARSNGGQHSPPLRRSGDPNGARNGALGRYIVDGGIDVVIDGPENDLDAILP